MVLQYKDTTGGTVGHPGQERPRARSRHDPVRLQRGHRETDAGVRGAHKRSQGQQEVCTGVRDR